MSQLNDTITALYTAWNALVPTTLAGALVFDGPPITPASTMDLVIIADDGGQDSQDQTTYEQVWLDLACTRREERGEILCSVITSSGATDMRTRRDRADVLISACEASLKADLTLGGVVASSELTRASSRLMQNTRGAAVVTPFTVRYRAII